MARTTQGKTTRKPRGPKPHWEDGSTFTLRLDKKLLIAFHQLASAQGNTSSEKIREFMMREVQAASRAYSMNN